VASDQPSESRMRHPTLGPALAIHDDRRRTRWRLGFWILMVPLGIAGLFMGRSDLASGNTLLGGAQIAGAIVLAVYALVAAGTDSQRARSPIRLFIAKDGFELSTGDGPVSWDEVATISDPHAPNGDPKIVRVQLDDPRGFSGRQSLSIPGRLMLTINRGDIVIGSGMTKPVLEVETLMRKQLAEFLRAKSAGPEAAAPSTAARPRPARSRRMRGR
jgi:hypothetical protein